VKNVRPYSLQRRLQLLAAISLTIAVIVLFVGVWSLDHVLNHDLEFEATDQAIHLVSSLGGQTLFPTDSKDIQGDLDRLLQRNPGAWYYYEDADTVIRSAAEEPRYRSGLTGEPQRLIVSDSSSAICSGTASWFRPRIPDGRAAVVAGGCGADAFYMEVTGFKVGESFAAHLWSAVEGYYFGEVGLKNRILPVGIVALVTILAITLLFGTLTKRIETVSLAASQIGKGKHRIRLPEGELPKEVLPMVQAVNRAIDRMEEASEQQGLFVAAAAHELRTPLTIIRTRLEQMSESQLKTELCDDLQRVDTMVTQLLTLAKLGAADVELEKLDLVEIARATCRERGGAVFAAGKELSFDAVEGDTFVYGDRESIRTAVANLIDNALMFTPPGKSVHVSVSSNRVVVTDEGPGVPKADKQLIFRPFFKSPPNKAGHGLGLAIVAEIMRIHGGSVDALDRAGGGAEFRLTFKHAA